MKYYLIAGESSGDLHGAQLMKALKKNDKQATFRYWGGDQMVKQGGELVKHYCHHAFMGFLQVVKNLRAIRQNFLLCQKDLIAQTPDVVILIDYSGFNLRIAKYAKKIGLKVIYYVSPHIWAWRQSRVKIIRQYVDKIIVIIPFEEAFYKKYQCNVQYVGYPLVDVINKVPQHSFAHFIQTHQLSDKPIVALLPGSRKQEISKKLPLMLSVIPYFSDYQFIIAGASSIEKGYYQQYCENSKVKIIFDKTYDILRQARAALVTSGTATMETAMLKIPQVVCYKTDPVSYRIVKNLVVVKYICMANLIMGKEIVKELIQSNCNTHTLTKALEELLYNQVYRKTILKNYDILHKKLGGGGASERAAKAIFEELTR